MSFHMNAAGTRQQVVNSLENIGGSDLGNDVFGIELRDSVIDAISSGADLEPPADQRYEVKISGHSGHDAIVTLTAEIKVVPVPPQAPDAQVVSEVPVTTS